MIAKARAEIAELKARLKRFSLGRNAQQFGRQFKRFIRRDDYTRTGCNGRHPF
jgi:hypothetical protein